MRFGGVASSLALFLSLATRISAQANLLSVLSDLPNCGSECFTSTIAESSCGFNVTCICTDVEFHNTAQSCILDKCSVKDGLVVARIEAEACERPQRSRQSELFIPLIVEVLAWLCPWLRAYSRWTTSNAFAMDDWLMVACGVIFTVFLVIGQYTGRLAFGLDTWRVDIEDVTKGLKLFYIDQSFYLTCLCLTKIAVVCFYLRIFPHREFQWASYATMAFVIIPTIVFIFMQIFQCTPVEMAWEGWVYGSQAEYCMDVNTLAYSAASFSIAQDLVILILPLPLLMQLNTGLRSKAGILFMFSLGVFVLVTSCVRLRYITKFGQTVNPSWDLADPLIWSGIEVSVSIIVACLPSIRVLIVRAIPGFLTSITTGGRSSRAGYVKDTHSTSGLRSGKQASGRRSKIFFASMDREDGNESQIELGLHLGDKVRGEVQTEICGPHDDFEGRDDGGIRINTTTTTRTTRADEDNPHDARL